eukprot:TCONS_00062616-protein
MSTLGKTYAEQDVVEFQLTIQGEIRPSEPTVIYSTGRKTAGEKQDPFVIIECFITGVASGAPSIAWIKEDPFGGKPKTIFNGGRYEKQLGGRRLKITDPNNLEDNGMYKCLPEYGLSTYEKQAKMIDLVVSSIPVFSTKPGEYEAYTDSSATLNCLVTGLPTINITWYRNGIPMTHSSDSHAVLKNNSIELIGLNWEDNGIFQCGAENYAGLFFVNQQLKVQNISAEIIGWSPKYYIHFNLAATIPCKTIGAPKPKITWLVNSTKIEQNSKYSFNKNGSLVIQNIQASDQGKYTCTASNYIDTDYKSADVYAVVKTRISKFPGKEFPVVKGDSPIIPCEVEHDKRVNYTREWRKVGITIPKTDKRYVMMEDGGLRVNFVKLDDTNLEFSCHIFADDANLTAATVLVMESRPFQPSSPRVNGEPKPNSLDLIWDAPDDGGSPIISYLLKMKNYTQTMYYKLADIDAPQTTYTVNNLQAGSKYRFQVAAKNKFGYGEYSAEATVWLETKTTAPSGPPLEFRSVDADTDYIVLRWEPPLPEKRNGQLDGYIFRYRVVTTSSYVTRKLNSLDTEYKMDGLPLFTKFEVQIAASNEIGIGPYTDSVFIETLQGKPVAPPTDVKVSIVNSTTVLVSFKSPRQALWNGKLTRIVALYWPPDVPEDQQTYETNYDTSNIHSQQFYLPRLEADKEYVLAVQVKTTGGPSPGSEKVQFKTTEGRPDSVRDLTVLKTYSDAFSVTWKPPLKPGGTLQGYKCEYRIASGKWVEVKEIIKGTEIGVVVKNLEPLTKYEVRVLAYTNAGDGSWEVRSATTIEKPELPHAPSSLKAYNVWGTVIALGWTPGYSGRAVILQYQIQYNNDTDYHQNPSRALWREMKNLTKILENPANLTYLQPNAVYRFRMRAYNRLGASGWSNISVDISTGEGVPSSKPRGLIVTAPARQTLEIKWIPPPRDTWNSDSVKYQFLIHPKAQDLKKISRDQYHVLTDNEATSYAASGLQRFTMYNVTMRLFNNKGYGPWSKHIFFRTSEDYPSGYPMNVRADVQSASSVLVKWGPVPEDQRNGFIIGYKVFYELKGFPTTEMFEDFPGNTTFSGTITKLNGYTDYEFRVMAYTKVGGLLKSPPVTRKTFEGKPGKPTNVRFIDVNYQYVQLEWDPPLNPNGRLSRYRVNYRQKGSSGDWTQVPVSTFNPRSARVNGMVFNRVYEFKIEATNSIGWGEPAIEEVLVTTERSVAQSPVILAIPSTSIRHTSVIVEWRARFDGNAPIRGYNLQFNKDLTGWQNYKHGIPPVENIGRDINKLEVLYLKPGMKYQFRVRAINDLGYSDWSESSRSVRTIQNEQKGAPRNVRVTKKTPTTLTIAWERPEELDLSSPIAGYRIQYQWLQSIASPLLVNTDDQTFEYTLKGLKVFSLYEVSVVVFTQLGAGTQTQPYKWRTGESKPTAEPTNVDVVMQGKSSVRVTWKPPDEESVRGYIRGYKIESRLIAAGSRRKRRDTSPNSKLQTYIRSHHRSRRALNPTCTAFPKVSEHLAGPYSTFATLKNLKKYTRYDITVRVYNSYADGPKSNPPVGFVTPEDVPGPPYILSDRQYTDLIDVDFAEPCEPNGQIYGYRAKYQEFGQKFSDPIDYPASQRRIRITGLVQTTRYILELTARTASGFGQKATIEFYTKGAPVRPDSPGAPEIHDNKPGFLILQWDEGANGHAPVNNFELQYRKGSKGGLVPFRDIKATDIRYDGSIVVSIPFSLKSDDVYRFRVRSTTKMGTSPWSDWSKPIKPVSAVASSKPMYEEIWFIFVLIIIFLILIVIIIVCCWRCQRGKDGYKPKKNGYQMSSFEMAMVNNEGGRGANSDTASQHKRLLPAATNGSLAPSIANSSMRKSIAKSASSGTLSDEALLPGGASPLHGRADGSIANHYSNDPFHKNWRDSMDKKTKKEIMADFAKRRPSQHSVDSLEEKKRMVPEYGDRSSRPRPGRKDINELRNLARSQPELMRDENPYNQNPYPQQPRHPQPRRPGKRPVDQELARSVPDLNRQFSSPGADSQVTRQPSFLRATGGDSDDNESLHEIFEREKSKRDLAFELDNRMNDYYPGGAAPPPYDFNIAPPAYSPSDASDTDYMRKLSGQYNDNPDYGRSRPAPPSSRGSSGRQPPSSQDRGYYNPNREYNRGYEPSPQRFPPRYPPEQEPDDGRYLPQPPSSSEPPHSPYASSSDHQFAPQGRFSPPQNAYIEEDETGDYPDGDMTLV